MSKSAAQLLYAPVLVSLCVSNANYLTKWCAEPHMQLAISTFPRRTAYLGVNQRDGDVPVRGYGGERLPELGQAGEHVGVAGRVVHLSQEN